MRVAFLIGSTNPVPTFGGEVRVYHLAKSLAQNSVQVDLFGSNFDLSGMPKNTRQFRLYTDYSGGHWFPITARGILAMIRRSPSVGRVARLLRDYDFVISELGAAWQVLPLSPLRKTPLILDEHNVEWQLMRQMEAFSSERHPWSRLRLYERVCHLAFDRVLVVSGRDSAFFQEDGTPAEKLITVPDGVDTEVFRDDPTLRRVIRDEYSIGSDVPLLLYMGSMRYFPNVDAARTIIERIFPEAKKSVPSLKMMILGGASQRILGTGSPDVIVVNEVIHTEVPAIVNAADVCIAPLRYGSGIKFKVLEWMACGKVVIATRKAAEGIDVTNGREIIIEDDLDMYPTLISRLLSNPEYASEIGRNARQFVVKSLDWGVCSEPLLRYIHSRG
jgi:glycosyltransferase involved in cell wall biosynthesis